MATYKNIRIKMKGGKTRLQRVMVLASGKYKFVKNLIKSKSRPKKAKTKKKKTSKKSNPKKGGNRRMGKSIETTAFKLLRTAALFGPGIGQALRSDRTPADKVYEILLRYTGGWFKGDGPVFQPHMIMEGYGPYLLTKFLHKGIQKASGIISRL